MSEKTHSLSLKIDAAAAKRGSDQFVAAIKAVQNAVSKLDRDTKGAFTTLSKGVKLKVDTSPFKDAERAQRSLTKAAQQSSDARVRVELAAAAAMRTSQSQADRLYEKLTRVGDVAGIAKLSRDLAQLETRLAKAATPMDVRGARSQFADSTSEQMSLNRSLELQERNHNIAANAASNHAATLDRLRSKYNPLYAASQQYEQALNEIARAERLGAISAKQAGAARERAAAQLASASGQMRGYGDAMRVAGHQSQNAAYQIQDVFVTAEMGMNPMRIALQQGSQLSMVMNDMARDAGGAKGALTGLVTGITSMVNPISLVTIGGIAAVAMLIQWAQSALAAGEETETFEKRLDALSAAVSAYRQYADQAKQSTSDMTARFGGLSGQASTTFKALATIGKLDAIRQADDAVAALTERFGGLSRTTLTYSDGVMTELDATYMNLRDTLNLTDQQAATVALSLERLATADTMQAKVEAANALNESFIRVFGSIENIPPALLNVTREALGLGLQMAEIEGAQTSANTAMERAHAIYQKTRQEAANAASTAKEMLATTTAQAEMNALVAQYGADSLQVTEARVAAERDAYQEIVNSLEVSDDLKAELMASWDAANGIASANMTGNISSAGAAAAVLARNLGIAVSMAASLGNLQSSKVYSGRGGDPRQFEEGGTKSGKHYSANMNYTPVADLIKQLSPPVRGGGGGGGRKRGSGGGGGRHSALSEEQKAVEKLNESITKRLESLEAERVALGLVTSGSFETADAAKLMAEAMTAGGGAVDQQTEAMIRQIDAASVLNDKLKRLSEDPVKKWVQSVPTWTEAGRQIEEGAIKSLSSALSQMMQTGKFDLESLGESILATVSDIVSDMAVRELMTLLGVGGQGGQPYGFDLGGKLQGAFGHSAGSMLDPANGGADVLAAMTQGGQTAGQTISNAMVQGGQQAAQAMRSAVTGAGSTSGAVMGAQVTTAGATSGLQMGTGISTSGQGAAMQMQQAITSGGQQAASMMGQASAGSGGGLFGGGGGGFAGIGLSIGMMLLSSVLNKKKDTPADTGPEPEFQPVESYAKGTPNTSGIPAMLHDNEAVIPLTAGRKVPVDLGDGGKGGGTVVNLTQNISTPDVDSFRRSATQVKKDAYQAGLAAARGIG